jgi:hypothetical protein
MIKNASHISVVNFVDFGFVFCVVQVLCHQTHTYMHTHEVLLASKVDEPLKMVNAKILRYKIHKAYNVQDWNF